MSITSANSVVTMTVSGLFPAPVQLQGYSADRAWETNAVVQTESVIGVDGRKTSGFIFNVVEQTFTLQGDSPSKFFFTQITNAQRAARDTLRIDGKHRAPFDRRVFHLQERNPAEFEDHARRRQGALRHGLRDCVGIHSADVELRGRS